MEFRRSGGRDERRRRVLMDEPTTGNAASDDAAPGSTTATDESTVRPAPDYADDAAAAHQTRLSDLVPHRAWVLSLLAVLAWSLASAIVAAAWYAPTWHWLDDTGRSIFSIAERGNLASWFASMLLLLTAAGAYQIYLLRRHKINDYRGHYRLWIWMAVVCFLASADAIMGAHHLLGSATRALLPAAWTPSPLLAWMLPLAAIIAAVGIRLAIEVRHSYGTCTALAFTAIGYLACAISICEPQWLSTVGVTDSHATATVALGCQLAGHFFLLLTTMLYGRYVFLAANGMLPVRAPRVRREKKPKKVKAKKEAIEPGDEAEGKPSRRAKTAAARSAAKQSEPEPAEEEPATVKVTPKATISKATASTPATKNDDTAPDTLSLEELAEQDDLSPQDTAHLSKAERRRLRKLQKRSNRAA